MTNHDAETQVPAAAGRRARRNWKTGRAASKERLVLVLALVVAAGVAIAFWTTLVPPAPLPNSTYPRATRMAPSDLASLNASATPALAFASNDTLWFPSGPVTLVVYLSPQEHDLTFVVQGLVNPTIHLSAGSHVTIAEVNLDGDMYHNWALSTQGPPYGSMPRMGGGMMGSGTFMAMTMLGPASASGYWSQQASFTATAGSYWYLCTYTGHAADGMYGSFIVG